MRTGLCGHCDFWKRHSAALGLILGALIILMTPQAHAASPEETFAASLGASDRQTFRNYIAARAFHDLTVNEYWG
jgi:hypothetical protein